MFQTSPLAGLRPQRFFGEQLRPEPAFQRYLLADSGPQRFAWKLPFQWKFLFEPLKRLVVANSRLSIRIGVHEKWVARLGPQLRLQHGFLHRVGVVGLDSVAKNVGANFVCLDFCAQIP